MKIDHQQVPHICRSTSYAFIFFKEKWQSVKSVVNIRTMARHIWQNRKALLWRMNWYWKRKRVYRGKNELSGEPVRKQSGLWKRISSISFDARLRNFAIIDCKRWLAMIRGPRMGWKKIRYRIWVHKIQNENQCLQVLWLTSYVSIYFKENMTVSTKNISNTSDRITAVTFAYQLKYENIDENTNRVHQIR